MQEKKEKAQIPNKKISNDLNALFPVKAKMVAWEDTSGHDRFPDVYKIKKLDHIISANQTGSTFDFQTANDISLKVIFLTDDILRFRYAEEGTFERDFSYAIDPEFNFTNPSILLEDTPDFYRLVGKKVHVKVIKHSGAVCITDIHGNILSEDAAGWGQTETILEGVTSVQLEKKSPKSEIFYGLGDKACSLNLRGKKFQNWNTDAFGYGTNSDPLYRSIPFYYGLRDDKAYGIFFDNSHRTWFDFDKNNSEQITFSAEGGELNYYFIAGPKLMDVAINYAQLTGKSELLPMWGMGFHQCRWSYYPETRVKEVAKEFRDRRIPCDAIYLDIDYMEGYRCFTVNEEHFPDLGRMCSELKADGFHTIVMIDPGIRTDPEYHVYKEGKERDYFCRRKDGKVMRGPVWPQDCAFPDYTKPVVRKWWGQLYDKLYNEQGVSGFWNDMNEPAVFKVNSATFPEDVRHDYEGMGAQHARIHNVYGLNMARATTEGLKDLQPDKRPIVITRASYSGGQRHSAAWTGDNVASWEHLAIANRQCVRMSISGFSYIGTDIGGFVDQPTGELMVRWLQLGIFHPFYRVHSMGNNEDGAAEADADKIKESERLNRLDQEPWIFGDRYTDLAREAIELRYQLQPYLYSTFYEHSKTGAPVLRQLAFYDQLDPNNLLREDEFLYGDHLLVVNIHKPGQLKKNIYLPQGDWVDYWSEESYKGKKEYNFDISIHHIPMFVKAGSFIPHYPVRQHTSEIVDSYELHHYYGNGKFQQTLFEDAGEGYEYKNGGYHMRKLSTQAKDKSIAIHQEIEGHWNPTYSKTKIVLHAIPFKVETIKVDGQSINFEYQEQMGNARYIFEVDNNFKTIEI